MASLRDSDVAQAADDGGDVVLLEEADGGDAGAAGFEAESGILNVYSAQC